MENSFITEPQLRGLYPKTVRQHLYGQFLIDVFRDIVLYFFLNRIIPVIDAVVFLTVSGSHIVEGFEQQVQQQHLPPEQP